MTVATVETDLVDIVCPGCHGPLRQKGRSVACGACAVSYEQIATGQLDLRLKQPKQHVIIHTIGPQRRMAEVDRSLFEPSATPNRAAKIPLDDRRWTAGSRLTPALMTHFPDPPRPGARLLDVGCGDGSFRPLVEKIGYRYAGFDYADPTAPFLAESRAYPYRDGEFDVVMMVGVFEHIEQPEIAAAEAFRVLRQGGHLVGEVAFGEPFHDNSFYHHSALGVVSQLERAGFEVKFVAPHPKWTALHAYTLMVMLHGMPDVLARAIAAPLYVAHRVWWKLAHLVRRDDKTSEFDRRHRTAGGFAFVARRPI